MQRFIRGTVVGLLLIAVPSCGGSVLDDDEATAAFVQCLERNGVEARDVRVTLDSDGTVSGIEAVIISETGAAYEPAVRLACTQEVEDR